MSADRYTFDTNVLFYALDPDAGAKHRIAGQLIATADCRRAMLVLQSLGELYNSIQKKRPAALPEAQAFVADNAALFDVVHATSEDLHEAILASTQHEIPFWDAMLWATARRAGCTLLLSEDLQDGRTLGGVTIRNPFAPGFDLDKL
jgi:predicted nucleic acid-binding protein